MGVCRALDCKSVLRLVEKVRGVHSLRGCHISRKTCISSPNFRRDRHALHIPKWKAHFFTGVPGCRLYETVPFIVLFVRTTLVVCIRTGWCCSLSMLASLVPFSSCCMLTRFANPGTFVPECISVAASMLPAGMFASHDQMHVNESISSAVCLLDHSNRSGMRRFDEVLGFSTGSS